MVLEPDTQLQVPAPSTVVLRLECADLGLNLAMLLVAEPKVSASFHKLLSTLSSAGFVGPAFDMSQVTELDRFEAASQRSDTLRRDQHNFYTRTEARFSEFSETMQRMKRDYYREIDHLREQLSRKRRNPDFEPESVVFFDPGGYRMPSWQDIVEQLDDMRMKRELLGSELGGDRVRNVPLNMLCERCRNRFQTPQEEHAAYEEEHRDQAIQCSFVQELMVETLSVPVQTDWVPVMLPLGLPDHASGLTPELSTTDAARKVPLVLQGATTEGPLSTQSRAPDGEQTEAATAGCHVNIDRGVHTVSEGESSTVSGSAMIDLNVSSRGVGEALMPLHSDANHVTTQGGSLGSQGVDVMLPSQVEGALALDIGDMGTTLQKTHDHIPRDPSAIDIAKVDATTQTEPMVVVPERTSPSALFSSSSTTEHKASPRSRKQSPGAVAFEDMISGHDEAGPIRKPTEADLERRAKLLSASLEAVFSNDPANQRRRALKVLRQNTMTQKQRACARLARQLEAIRKHVERQALTRLRAAVSGHSLEAATTHLSEHGMHSVWQRAHGTPLIGSEIGALSAVKARPQQMVAAGDARARVQRARPRSGPCEAPRFAMEPDSASSRRNGGPTSPLPWEQRLLSMNGSAMSDSHSGRPGQASNVFPWEVRAHTEATSESDLGLLDFRLQTAPDWSFHSPKMGPQPFAEQPTRGGAIIRSAAFRRRCAADGECDAFHRMHRARSTGDLCLPKLTGRRPSPSP